EPTIIDLSTTRRENQVNALRVLEAIKRPILGSIQRLDAIDVLRVDGGEPVARNGAIDDDQRTRHIGGWAGLAGAGRLTGERGRGAQTNDRLAAGRATRVDQPHPGHLTFE